VVLRCFGVAGHNCVGWCYNCVIRILSRSLPDIWSLPGHSQALHDRAWKLPRSVNPTIRKRSSEQIDMGYSEAYIFPTSLSSLGQKQMQVT
jgi:hypothetical protein